MDYDEASSDMEGPQQRQPQKGKKQAGKKGEKGKTVKGAGKGFHKEKEVEGNSDLEEEETKEYLKEQNKMTKAAHYNAFSEDEEDNAEAPEEDQPDDKDNEVSPYIDLLSKDLKLFGVRLQSLEPLLKHSRLSQDGRDFITNYVGLLKVYVAYIYSGLIFASKREESHPVFRKIAQLRTEVKKFDKLWRERRDEVEGWSPEQEEGDGEEGLDEEGLEGDENIDGVEEYGELDSGLEEEEEMSEEELEMHEQKQHSRNSKVSNQTTGSRVEKKRNNKKEREGVIKKKVQTFSLAPKSFSEIHHYQPAEDVDEDDRVLNLGKRKPLKPLGETSGEITMNDLKHMEANDALEAKLMRKRVAKPTENGKKLYEEMAQEKSKTQSLSNALKAELNEKADKFKNKVMFNERRVSAEEPRTLTQTMLLNQGLKVKRGKKISRVKLREKYEKAQRLNASKHGGNHVRDREDMLRGTGDAMNREIKLL